MKIENVVLPEMIYNEEYDIHIRPYLTADEIIQVAETAMTMDNPMEQEVSIAVNVIRMCTDANDDGALDDMDIDRIMWSGLWQTVAEEIMNFDMVLAYIHYRENAGIALANFLNKTAPQFLNALDKGLNKYIKRLPKGAEWNEFMQEAPKMLEDVLKQVKEDGNAEIIAGAAKMGE